MNRVLTVFLVGSLAAASTAAPAQTRNDPLAARAIARGDFPAAEQRLSAERRIYPNRPEILLNLAAVYARTDRTPEARALYQVVLANDDVLMDLPDGDATAGSHRLATAGLARLDAHSPRLARN